MLSICLLLVIACILGRFKHRKRFIHYLKIYHMSVNNIYFIFISGCSCNGKLCVIFFCDCFDFRSKYELHVENTPDVSYGPEGVEEVTPYSEVSSTAVLD